VKLGNCTYLSDKRTASWLIYTWIYLSQNIYFKMFLILNNVWSSFGENKVANPNLSIDRFTGPLNV